MIKRGKVKDIYEVAEDVLLFEFSDRVSAFDVVLPTPIPRKGEVLNRFAEFFFKVVEFPNHMIERVSPRQMTVKRLSIIPIEFVIRGYLYGSLYERVQKGEVRLDIEPVLAAKLPSPILDPTTKSDVKDVPITKQEVVSQRLLLETEYDMLSDVSIRIYNKLAGLADKAGFIMADLKIEFGKDKMGNVYLADSIGPDEFRLWPKESYKVGKPQESFDKQVVRDWLISVGYRDALNKARSQNLPPPPPPELPRDIVELTAKRYIEAFERITGTKF